MIRQVLLLLPAITACVAIGDGKANHATKNVFQKQGPLQYQSVAAFHSSAPLQGPTFNAPSSLQGPTVNVPASLQGPTFNTHSRLQGPTFNAESSLQGPTMNARSSLQGPTSNAHSRLQGPTFNAERSPQGPSSNTQGSLQGPTFNRASLQGPTSNTQGSLQGCCAPTFNAQNSLQGPTMNAQSSLQGPTMNTQSSLQGPTSNAHASLQGPTFNARSSIQGPTFNARSSLQGPTFNAQSSLQDPTVSLQGPTSSLQGPTFNAQSSLQGPTFNSQSSLQGPTSSLQGPTFNTQGSLQGPTMSLQGPTSSLRGPTFNAQSSLQGPTFNARSSLQGPTFNTQGSFQGPTSSLQGPTSNAQSSLQGPTSSLQGPTFPYSFAYETSGSAHQESSDGSGKVTGSYRVSNEDGSSRLVSYVADHQGFRAEVQTDEAGAGDGQPADVVVRVAPPKKYAAPVEQQPIQQTQYAPAALFQSSAPAVKTAHQSSQQGQQSPAQQPIPYSFSYDAQGDDGSSSRTESGDGRGQVAGSYGLRAADGRYRKVQYVADEAGFRATVDTNELGTRADSPADVQFYSSAKVEEPIGSSGGAGSSMYDSKTEQQNPIQFTLGEDGAYAYSHESWLSDGGSIAQAESGDGSGNVAGHYSLGGPDGRFRKVHYSAGRDGFRASVDTNESGTKSDSPAHVTFLSAAEVAAPPPAVPSAFNAPAPKTTQQRSSVKAPAPKATPHHSSGSSVIGQEKVEAPVPYAFTYDTEGASRQETADGSGTVTGTYTIRQEDGSLRVVEYVADKDGFRANVKSNEPGTLGGVEAAAAHEEHRPAPEATPHHAPKQLSTFGQRTGQKGGVLSQKRVDAWSR